jgi:hypothetical protein
VGRPTTLAKVISGLVGRRVATVALSFVAPHVQLHLPAWTEQLDAAIDYVVQIDGLTQFASTPEAVDPDSGPYDLFTALLRATVTTSEAGDDGTLRLEFDGQVLTVPPDDQYEPWQVYGSDGFSLVSLVGGGLTQFGGAPAGPGPAVRHDE